MLGAIISPAPNIDIIIDIIESRYGLEYVAPAAPALNIIDDYSEREGEEEELQRKGIINICVCGLLLLLIIVLFGGIYYI